MFFEIETGKIVGSCSGPTIHCADDMIHFWDRSPFMYNIIDPKKEFANFLASGMYDHRSKKFQFYREEIEELGETIWIDDRMSRFGFTIKSQYIEALSIF